jgi:hypothetical protein
LKCNLCTATLRNRHEQEENDHRERLDKEEEEHRTRLKESTNIAAAAAAAGGEAGGSRRMSGARASKPRTRWGCTS